MIKRVMTAAFLLALAASPAFAYVPPGGMGLTYEGNRLTATPIGGTNFSPDTQDNEPSHPVPEPGTIAMASMGLMALGAHLRRRRGN